MVLNDISTKQECEDSGTFRYSYFSVKVPVKLLASLRGQSSDHGVNGVAIVEEFSSEESISQLQTSVQRSTARESSVENKNC